MTKTSFVRHNMEDVVHVSQHLLNPSPFLKWVGGKRALLPKILPVVEQWRVSNPNGRYFEPFVGAGAVLFNVDPNLKKFANDYNHRLIEVYKVIKNDPKGLINELEKHRNEPDYFYQVREWDRLPSWDKRTSVEVAARFIFLNKTCFNGLYRENRNGKFNVPFGNYKNPRIVDIENIMSVSRFLNSSPKTSLTSGDYRECTKKAKTGDFVYFDPPYDPVSKTSSFTAYVGNGFAWKDQVELRDEATRLVNLGIKVLLSNSNTKRVRKIYQETGLFKINTVEIHRGISSKNETRGVVKELLIESKV